MRLIDQLMVGDVDPRTMDAERQRAFRADLAGVPVFVVDNVAEYIYGTAFATGDDPTREWGKDWTRDFPNVAPPFPRYWMEYNLPRTRGEFNPQVVGCFARAVELPTTAADDPRWQWTATVIVGSRNADRAPVAANENAMRVDADGAANEPFTAEWASPGTAELFGPSAPEASWGLLYPILLATSLMHCRNVLTVEGQSPRHERRRFEREHGRPAVRFYTLDIQPMRRVLADAGAETPGGGLRKALHIARGHFKTFGGANRKLFGKIEGRFWWPDQVRGTSERGAVVKDYRVQPPTNGGTA